MEKMIDKAQLEALIQREAENRFPCMGDCPEISICSNCADEFVYKAGASILAPALLEALGALEKCKRANERLDRGGYALSRIDIKAFADQALQRIKELLGGGK